MTGIERLRELARVWTRDCKLVVEQKQLADIADQIEREQNEMVADSPYDALRPDDREAIAWVREHGGVEVLRRMFQDAVNRRVELCGSLGTDLDKGWSDAMAAMRLRLMPEDMEWPRYEDGEQARPGDEVYFERYDAVITIDKVAPRCDGYSIYDADGIEHVFDSGLRLKRPEPEALDADGEEIRVGDHVWNEVGTAFTAIAVDGKNKSFKAMRHFDGQECEGLNPAIFTHRAPVIAADGMPLREGETVWHKSGFACGVVETIDAGSLTHTTCYRGDDGTVYRDAAKNLVHERPDSWERIEEDAGCTATKYNERRGTIFTTKQQVARDLVRRAKKLAGVSE